MIIPIGGPFSLMGKPVFGTSDKVKHKPTCADTESSSRDTMYYKHLGGCASTVLYAFVVRSCQTKSFGCVCVLTLLLTTSSMNSLSNTDLTVHGKICHRPGSFSAMYSLYSISRFRG